MDGQQWFNDNQPNEDLIYRTGMINQFVWVRDRLSHMMLGHLGFDWEERKGRFTIDSTHTSKSVTMPVYTITGDGIDITVRGNFHDWCVGINGCEFEIEDVPDYMRQLMGTGYYEGMGNKDDYDFHFCVQTQEQLYSVLWWVVTHPRDEKIMSYNPIKGHFLQLLDGCGSPDPDDLIPYTPPLKEGLDSYRLGICKLEIIDDELHVHLRRPGLLIGRCGETINKLTEELGHKILVHEAVLTADD